MTAHSAGGPDVAEGERLPVRVYHRTGCPFALRLHALLRLHGVPHTMIRFSDDESGAASVRAAAGGNEISPTVHIGGDWLVNPTWREVATRAGSRASDA